MVAGRTGSHEPCGVRWRPDPDRVPVRRPHLYLVRDLQARSRVRTARGGPSGRLHRRRGFRPLSRDRGRRGLREAPPRGAVRGGGDRISSLREFLGHRAGDEGMAVNFLGVFGPVVLDYIANLESLPTPNTSVQILDRERYFGGTGGNIARISARLGVRTALASFVGEDFPKEYRDSLKSDGVDLTDLRVVRGVTTPTAWIFTDPRGNQIAIVDQGPMRYAA